MIASRLGVPVVPLRLDGLDTILPTNAYFVKPGTVRVAFGEALVLRGDNYTELALQVEERVRSL